MFGMDSPQEKPLIEAIEFYQIIYEWYLHPIPEYLLPKFHRIRLIYKYNLYE